jgi:hypothetical protein
VCINLHQQFKKLARTMYKMDVTVIMEDFTWIAKKELRKNCLYVLLCPFLHKLTIQHIQRMAIPLWILLFYSCTGTGPHPFLSIILETILHKQRKLTNRGLSMRAWRQHSAASCSRPFLM